MGNTNSNQQRSVEGNTGAWLVAVAAAAGAFYYMLRLLSSRSDSYDRLSIDCEMVGGYGCSYLARVSIVDKNGRCVYDALVKPQGPVYDFRTRYHGITPEVMNRNGRPFREVQSKVRELMSGGCLWIGHSVEFDQSVLKMTDYPEKYIRDIATYPEYKRPNGQKRSLKDLASEYLGMEIQVEVHDSVEDAYAAMKLYAYAAITG